MNSTPNLFVKLIEPKDRLNVEFSAFANGKSISETARRLFETEAERIRKEYPELWANFQRIKAEQ